MEVLIAFCTIIVEASFAIHFLLFGEVTLPNCRSRRDLSVGRLVFAKSANCDPRVLILVLREGNNILSNSTHFHNAWPSR